MNDTMKAAVLYAAGDVRVESLPSPALDTGMVLLRIRRAGICGSDLHYYELGHCGTSVVDRPFILGHEFAAEVADVADGVTNVKIGQRVTANPARACGLCDYCKAGRGNLCLKTVMLGSAGSKPPTNGAMAEFVTVRADQCHILPDEINDETGAMLEPLAVALHAIKRSGGVSGKRVLVLGAGTIGRLVAGAAKAHGAVPVAITEVVPERRHKAQDSGVAYVLDPEGKDFLEEALELTGLGFDTIFEASASPRALRQAFDVVRPGGTIVQIGTQPNEDLPLPALRIMRKEINYIGSQRYGDVFDEAIRLVASGRINLRSLMSDEFRADEAAKAFRVAADRTHSLKVQLQL
jgi:2-desacetyl-2-hydroxyethyl bacteriochlorophyllide A dehydrogenase